MTPARSFLSTVDSIIGKHCGLIFGPIARTARHRDRSVRDLRHARVNLRLSTLRFRSRNAALCRETNPRSATRSLAVRSVTVRLAGFHELVVFSFDGSKCRGPLRAASETEFVHSAATIGGLASLQHHGGRLRSHDAATGPQNSQITRWKRREQAEGRKRRTSGSEGPEEAGAGGRKPKGRFRERNTAARIKA
jgi:hypothetical protein